MFNNLKLFATVMVLHIFLFQINTSAPYPTINRKSQKFRASYTDTTHYDARHAVANTSRLLLPHEHAHDRRARQAGCVISTTVEHCGNHMIVTVKCRRQSVACIGPGVFSPTCVTQKTYYQACGKAFATACMCKS